MTIADTAAAIDLPMERPLHTPAVKPRIADSVLHTGDAGEEAELALQAMYAQMVVDKAQLGRHIRHSLQDREQVTLGQLCQLQPLQHGLAELVAYLQLADDTAFHSALDENETEIIAWQGLAADGASVAKQAQLPRVVFLK
jgi:hypothetical protein